MSIKAIARLNQTKEVALTDANGAAAFVQNIFDKYKLNLKVKVAKTPRKVNDHLKELLVTGKTSAGKVLFAMYLDSNGSSLNIDPIDTTGTEHEAALNLFSFTKGAYGLEGTSNKDLKALSKRILRESKDVEKAIALLAEVSAWNLQLVNALTEINEVMTRESR